MYISCRKEYFIFNVFSEENELWPFLCLSSFSVPLKAEAEFKPFECEILQKRTCLLLLLLNSLLITNFSVIKKKGI